MGESRIQEAESDAHSLTIIPPVGGWNTRDPISNMDPQYAVEMENYFADGGTVSLRKGYLSHATGVGSSVSISLFEYVRSSGTRFLLAESVSATPNLYDATAAGAATDIDGGNSLANDGPLDMVNFMDRVFMKTYGNNRDVYVWQGAGTITTAAFTMGAGGDDKDLKRPAVYRKRLYFIQYTAPVIWYTELPGAITGNLLSFDLSSELSLGGNLLFIGSTSLSGNGANIDNVFVMISEMGEILIYEGDYPTASNWRQIGKYYIAAPAAPKSFFYWGQDVIIITREGLVALSSVVNAGTTGQYQYLSDAIAPTFKEYINYAVSLASPGPWYISGLHYPQGNYLLINIPIDGATIQFVMNTITRAWAMFTNQTAGGWSLYNNALYFGGSGGVIYKADTGYFDDNGSGVASNRATKLRFAYNYFGDPEHVKQFVSAIPTIYESEGLSLTLDVDVDYANTAAVSTVTNTTDTSYKLYQPICGLKGIGTAGSIRLDQTVTTKRRSIQAVKVIMKTGTIGK